MNERLLEKLRAVNRSDQLLTKEQYVMLQRLQRLKWERVRRAQLRTGQKKLFKTSKYFNEDNRIGGGIKYNERDYEVLMHRD